MTMKKPCIFCQIDTDRIVSNNKLAYAIRDGFPVTAGHTLIIPKRHAETFFDLSDVEILACNELLHEQRKFILATDQGIDGFNIGMNAGAAAGQTVFHCHIHLIPRRIGDVGDPRGGVRHIIPNKGFYKADE